MKSTLVKAIFVLAAAALIAVFLIRWQGGNDAGDVDDGRAFGGDFKE